MSKILGQYTDDYEDIVNEDKFEIGLSKIYMAKNKNNNKYFCLKVISKEKLKNQNYIFIQDRLKKEQEIQTLCNSDNTLNFYRRLETDDNIIFELEYFDDNLYNYLQDNGELKNEKKFFKKIVL